MSKIYTAVRGALLCGRKTVQPYAGFKSVEGLGDYCQDSTLNWGRNCCFYATTKLQPEKLETELTSCNSGKHLDGALLSLKCCLSKATAAYAQYCRLDFALLTWLF